MLTVPLQKLSTFFSNLFPDATPITYEEEAIDTTPEINVHAVLVSSAFNRGKVWSGNFGKKSKNHYKPIPKHTFK